MSIMSISTMVENVGLKMSCQSHHLGVPPKTSLKARINYLRVHQKSALLTLCMSTHINFQDFCFLKIAIGTGGKVRDGQRKMSQSRCCAGKNIATCSLEEKP